MPNAKDVTAGTHESVFVVGPPGAGKTTNFLTMPGRKFAYLFDPNAIQSLRGYDVDYEEYLPDRIPLQLASLSKSAKKDRPGLSSVHAAEVYLRFEEHAESSLQGGFFDQYDSILFDSATSLLNLIMDRVLFLNGRAGLWPQEDDWAPQMSGFMKIFRSFTSLKKNIYLTGHIDMRTNRRTKETTWQMLLTGRLRTVIPLQFSNIFNMECQSDSKQNTKYTIQTKSSRDYPHCRTSMKELSYYEDVTIDFDQDPVGQGIGGVLLKE